MTEKKVTTDDPLPGPQGVVTTNGTEPDIPEIEEWTIPNAEPIEDPPHIGAENRIRYFRENLYPYAHRMRNREYNALNRPLQVELIKLQNWIRDVGERVIILFEGRDAAGKGGLSGSSWSIGTRVMRNLSRWTSRRMSSWDSGTSNATSDTFQRPGR